MLLHPKLNLILNFLLLLLLLISAGARETRCLEREREALLRFKKGLTDDSGCLSSWKNEEDKEECCDWDRVYCSNSTGKVTNLDFYGCWLRGNMSSDLLELNHLIYLDMSYNHFGGSIPSFLGSMKSLEDIRFMENNLTGTIPHQLGNLTNLRILTFNYNHLVHEIPKSFANLTKLQILYINVNFGLGEPLADFFGKLSCKSLESLDISLNQYTGPIPDLRACSKLAHLSIHHNLLSGPVPSSLGQLSKLGYIDASFNSLQGRIKEAHFSKLENLYLFFFSNNHPSLILDLSQDWVPPFQLNTLNLASCKMGPSFPRWIKTQTSLSALDLSDSGIIDQVPDWLWSLSQDFRTFNISHNQIWGTIPIISANFFGMLDVSYNKFSGPLPLLHPNITVAHFGQNLFNGTISFICQMFNSKLQFLDLSNNQLEGELPSCWNNTNGLKSLNLNNNKFNGEIPFALGELENLETLHLRENNFSGNLPPSLRNCRSLILIDIGGNKLTGEIPEWLARELTHLTHLSLRQNRFHGGISTEICRLSKIQMLDLSGNDISGEIPSCFDNFTSLVEVGGEITQPISFYIDYMRSYFDYVVVQWKGQDLEYKPALRLLKLIDLSNNRLSGSIPKEIYSLRGLISLNLSTNRLSGRIGQNISQMGMLETLDISHNQISGEIPTGLAQLHFLSVLDLANNNLSGQIPLGTQLQGFNASAYMGNDGLCGPPLPLCPNTSITDQGQRIKKGNGGFFSISNLKEFYISLVLGFVVGFLGVVGTLVLKNSWRDAYFGFLDGVGDWLSESLTRFLAKFRQS